MSDIIAWALLLFAGITLILSIRANRRKVEAEGRANVTARFVDRGSGLVIHNDGPAVARKVDLKFTEPQRVVSQSELSANLPIAVLAVRQEVRLIANLAHDTPMKYDIRLIWEDSKPRSEQRVLSL